MKVLKYACSILYIALFFFFVSCFYRLILLFLLTCLWKKEICYKFNRPHLWAVVMACFALACFIILPRYRYATNDRVRLIYQDKDYHAQYPPLLHYLLNVILPEEELMNAGVWVARFGPSWMPYIGQGRLLKQFQDDDKDGKTHLFYRPYHQLNRKGLFMLSGATSQVCNMAGLPQTRSVYVIRPKNFDPDRKYPVVFFCHGGMGNWKLYQGLWKGLEDCIVLSAGTRDWNGFFKTKDIKSLFTHQLDFIESLGMQVDKKNLHLIGISNGGTASNVAYQSFNKQLKSITFISTGIHQTYPVYTKIILIGGGRDGSSQSLPGAYLKMKQQGNQTAMYWKDDETHYIFVNKQDEIIDFLNQEILASSIERQTLSVSSRSVD